uniref:Uncharacterized protein n=1 Tax=Cacopsylla melanoneura TaxID=428564 RepID=A0A8D8T835_9HEMI
MTGEIMMQSNPNCRPVCQIQFLGRTDILVPTFHAKCVVLPIVDDYKLIWMFLKLTLYKLQINRYCKITNFNQIISDSQSTFVLQTTHSVPSVRRRFSMNPSICSVTLSIVNLLLDPTVRTGRCAVSVITILSLPRT